MSFAWPTLLWLLLLPLGLLTFEMTRRRRRNGESAHPKILRAEIASDEIALLREPAKASNARVRPWLALGLAFTIVALARPQWGRIEEPVFDQSREILLAIDLSRSMLSPDVKPSRLDRAKLLVQSLLEKLKGERVGLIVFSGTAFLQSPLSSDYEILREFLPALNPDFLPEGGTNYRALVDTALDAFGGSSAADRFLIILSDGEATDDSWQSGIDELKKRGVRVIGLGVGTIAGTMIPDGTGGFVKDQRGAVVLSKLESGTLQQLANATNGTYRDASTWIDLASLIDQTVNEGKKGSFVVKATVRYVERFQWPLAFALWCFLVSFFFEFPVQPRARDIALRPATRPTDRTPAPAAKAVAVVLWFAAIVGLALRPESLHAAVKVSPPAATAPAAQTSAPPTGDPAALGRIVGRLSQQRTLSAPDLSELAHETLNWGHRIQDAGQPVPDGPVRDALSAVDELEARGDKLADWSQLRKELEALRQRPPEQKPPPQKDQNQQQNKDQQKQDQQKPQQQDKNQNGSPEDKKQSQPQNEPDKPDQNKQDSSKNETGEKPENKDEAKNDQPAAFGDMNKQQPPPPPPPPGETQKVGGAPEKKEENKPADPALALPLQKLEQLKNEDSPGKLFQLMQAERSQGSQKKPAKDW
jgi:Ca-activated chloride channel family protein